MILPDFSKKTWFLLFALGFLLVRVVPLVMLDRTDISAEKRAQDPFSRNVRITSQDNEDESEEASSDQTNSLIRVPPEHLASYLMANLMGGLKQVATTSMWVKYTRLKEEQRYNEAVALLEILKVLQPDREQVWRFLADDIAFNISNRQPTDELMWAKVKKGAQIALDGNKRMGGSIDLLNEAGWIYGFRVPQEPYMMHQTWKERGKTNYRIALEYMKQARALAKQRGVRELETFSRRYAFMINWSFYDLVMLLHYEKYPKAQARYDEYRTLAQSLIADYVENNWQVPGPYRTRLASYEMLPRVMKADKRLAEVPSSNRRKKIKRTKQFLKQWKRFFHRYPGALAEEAVRHALRQSFELLRYVSRDLERFYKTGNEKFRQRASNLLRDELAPAIDGLTPNRKGIANGYARKAHADLGTFWKQMNEKFKHQQALKRANDEQEAEDVRRRLEDVYAELLKLYRSNHRGFNMKWFEKRIQNLESENILNH